MSDDIFSAVADNDVERVGALLAADPSKAATRGADGVSVLLAARYRGLADIVELIRRATPALDIHEAAAMGDVGRITELIGAGPEAIGSYSADGWLPLHLASFFGQYDAAKLLLASGAKIGGRSRKPLENTALNAAAAANHLDVCRLLLEAGADPNSRQAGGYVPLHAAAQNGNRPLAELLLERGADRASMTDDGRTPLDLARAAGWEELSEILEP